MWEINIVPFSMGHFISLDTSFGQKLRRALVMIWFPLTHYQMKKF